MSERKILVTGGSGFIGTNLIAELARNGIPVLNLDCSPPLDPRLTSSWTSADVRNHEALKKVFDSFQPTEVVHLAAKSETIYGTDQDFEVNSAGTTALLEATKCCPSVERLIVTSSMLVCRPGYLRKSDQDYAPGNPYGRSKVKTEQLTRESNLRCTWTIIRPTTIWGPWHLRLMKEVLRMLASGTYLHPARNSCVRAYGYVGNVVHQIGKLLQAPREQVHGKTLYVGDPPMKLFDFVNGFSLRLRGRRVRVIPPVILYPLAAVGDLAVGLGWKNAPLTSYRLSNLLGDNIIDVSETLAITGPSPYTLAQGIEETARWVESVQQVSASTGTAHE